LAETLAALSAQGSDYYVAAEIQNITLPPPIMESMGIPGLPAFLDADLIPVNGRVRVEPRYQNRLDSFF